jgi:hypothetical protein
MRRRHREGLLDKSFRRVIDWGLGVIVNSARHNEGILPYGFGAKASDDTFGHGGNQSSAVAGGSGRTTWWWCSFSTASPGRRRTSGACTTR